MQSNFEISSDAGVLTNDQDIAGHLHIYYTLLADKLEKINIFSRMPFVHEDPLIPIQSLSNSFVYLPLTDR